MKFATKTQKFSQTGGTPENLTERMELLFTLPASHLDLRATRQCNVLSNCQKMVTQGGKITKAEDVVNHIATRLLQ